jgi:hypothetical protein
VESRLGAVEQEVFLCKGMVERGLDANHLMIKEFTRDHKLDAKNFGEAIFKLHERFKHLQAQINNLQNQNYEYEYRFKKMSSAADLRISETRSSFYDGEPMPWKMEDKITATTPPPTPPSPKKETRSYGMGTPLGQGQVWGSCPGIVSSTLSLLLFFLVRS